MTSIALRLAARAVLATGLLVGLADAAAAVDVELKNAEAKRAPSAAEAEAGKTPYFRTEVLTCSGANCIAQIQMNAKRVTTITTVSCIVPSTGGQLKFLMVVDGATTLALLPVASRAVEGAKELAVVYNSTNLTFTGGTLTLFGVTSGTGEPGGGCVLQGTSVKK